MKHLLLISIMIFSSHLVSCEKNGPGTETYEDGSKYVGEYKDGNPWSGTQYNADGSIRGKYKEGKWES